MMCRDTVNGVSKIEGGQTATSYGALPPRIEYVKKYGCVLALVRSSHFLAASRLPTEVSIARVGAKCPLENPSFWGGFWRNWSKV